MSLKAFHIIFIAASTLLAFGFGAWWLVQFFNDGKLLELLFAILSALAGAALIFYGRYFLKKLKDISYL